MKRKIFAPIAFGMTFAAGLLALMVYFGVSGASTPLGNILSANETVDVSAQIQWFGGTSTHSIFESSRLSSPTSLVLALSGLAILLALGGTSAPRRRGE